MHECTLCLHACLSSSSTPSTYIHCCRAPLGRLLHRHWLTGPGQPAVPATWDSSPCGKQTFTLYFMCLFAQHQVVCIDEGFFTLLLSLLPAAVSAKWVLQDRKEDRTGLTDEKRVDETCSPSCSYKAGGF